MVRVPTGSSPLTRIIVLPVVAVALLAILGIPAFFIVPRPTRGVERRLVFPVGLIALARRRRTT